MPSPFRHVELSLYADDTAVLVTSRLSVRQIPGDISVTQSGGWKNGGSPLISRRTPPCSLLRPVEASRNPDQPSHWVDTARYLGVILDTGATCSTHINHVRRKAAQRLRMLGSFQKRRSGLYKGMEFCCTSISSVLWWTTRSRLEVCCLIPI